MFLDLFLNGVVQGCLLALICVGYSLAYGTAQVVNFAHADVMIAGGGYLVLLWASPPTNSPLAAPGMAGLVGVGAAIMIWAWLRAAGRGRVWVVAATLFGGGLSAWGTYEAANHLPFLGAALLAIPVTGILAAAVYTAGYAPLLRRGAPRTTVLLAALGLSICVQSLLLIMWGSQQRVFSPQMLPSLFTVHGVPADGAGWEAVRSHGLVPLGGGRFLPIHDLVIVGAFLVVSLSLAAFFRFNRLGDQIVASADARLAARACGIPVDRAIGSAFAIGGAVAAVAGILFVVRAKSFHPTSGLTPGILAFAACVLGGIGSLRGSILGAFLISLLASLAPAIPLDRWAATHLSPELIQALPSLSLADWSYGVVYVLMVITILIRPQGLFSR